MLSLQPYGSRLIARLDIKGVSSGGIILPEDSEKTTLLAYIVEAGDKCKFVSVGDKVVLARFGGYDIPKEISLENPDYVNCVIMNEADIIAKQREVEND